jgi:hypothetical protein
MLELNGRRNFRVKSNDVKVVNVKENDSQEVDRKEKDSQEVDGKEKDVKEVKFIELVINIMKVWKNVVESTSKESYVDAIVQF